METKIYFAKHFIAITIVILIYCLVNGIVDSQCTDDDDCFNNNNHHDDDGSRILSRKRRALVFPEGSSLQLVYDQTIPIVAAQLLFTVGVTCALAFALPSEPIYKITQQLKHNLFSVADPEDPAADSSNDTDIKRMDYATRLKYNEENYYNTLNKHNFYYSNAFISDKSDKNHKSTVFITPSPLNLTQAIWTGAIKTFINKYGEKTKTVKTKKFQGKKILGNVFLRKHHRVYPVFGKRSVDDHLYKTEEDRFFMDHHRNSRFDLYERIEGFLNGQGKNGKSCVLKALCETAQKNQNDEKGPFVIEILRAVFSLPHQTEAYKNENHEKFDLAHSTIHEDCSKLYPDCKDSFWSHDFKF